jgi:hypothetical protein
MKDSEYIRYHGVRSINHDVFLLNHQDFVNANDHLHAGLGTLAQGLRGKRDAAGKSYVSFIPFLALMQRQAFSAFDHLASFQAYQAWLMVRPAVEIPLIMGKWIDDPSTAEIWNKREVDPQAYQKEYTGKKMRSNALPHSDQIQSVLKVINDQFVHPNTFYYHRHLQLACVEDAAISIEMQYFDPQEIVESYVLAFLHLFAMMHDYVREMMLNLVGSISGSIAIVASIESQFLHHVLELGNADPVSKRILSDLGCWPDNST